jgi:hypothetical protein
MDETMTETTLPNIGLAYRWLLAYYKEVAQLYRRVREEFETRGFKSFSKDDAIEARGSKSLAMTEHWLPCYQYQLFESPILERPGLEELDLVALLCVGIDHYDPRTPERPEPLMYLVRFGPVPAGALGQIKNEIVYNWDVDEPDAPTWRASTFRKKLPYTYCTRPLSDIVTLDDVVPNLIDPLVAHDREQGGAPPIGGPPIGGS